MRNNLEERFEELRSTASQEVAPTVEAATEQQKGPTLNFVVPTEMVDLPSRGQYYPPDHPLHNKESVEIRQMTAKEEDILTNKSFIKKGIVIDRLLESLLIDKNIKVDSLLAGDRNAIMVASRVTGYGPDYGVSLLCQECGIKSSHEINLEEMVVRDSHIIQIDSENDEKLKHSRLENGNIVVQLPRTGWFVECRLLNGSDEKRLLSYMEAKRKKDPEAELTLSEQVMFIVDSINTVDDKKILIEAIYNMPARDAKHLRTIYQKLIPNVRIKKKYTCSSCFEEQDVEVPFTQEFFWPK
jgi:hypothetical protein